jgi:hypothetical protein
MSFSIGHNIGIRYGVMWLPWMLVISCRLGHGNMIGLLSTIGGRTLIRVVPELVKELLGDFADVFPEGLPPLRDIQHQIDLVSGSNLPNCPHYYMNPKEREELRRHVEDLLVKGHVGESLSPCAVLALLLHPRKKMGHGGCVWIVGQSTRSL